MRRRSDSEIGRWARRKIAEGKPYLVMCVAAGRKAVVRAWHCMMDHPVPDREAERLFRYKLMLVYRALGVETAATLAFRTSAAYADTVMKPAYAHLAGAATAPSVA